MHYKSFFILVLFFTSCFSDHITHSDDTPDSESLTDKIYPIDESTPLLPPNNPQIPINPETIKYTECLSRSGENCALCSGYNRASPLCPSPLPNIPDCLIPGPHPSSCSLCRHGYILSSLSLNHGKCFPLASSRILSTCSHPYHLDRRHLSQSF